MIKLYHRLGLALLLVIPAAWGNTPAENLAEAVRFKTISFQDRAQIDYQQFDALNSFLTETYPRVFSQLQVESVSDYSWLIRWPGTDETLSPILFTAHTDVVPVEPGTEGDWSHPAFAGIVADGRVYGRGTLDDKQGVISLLEAAEQLLAEGYQPAREIVFAFGHDEEISGLQGAGVIAQRMKALHEVNPKKARKQGEQSEQQESWGDWWGEWEGDDGGWEAQEAQQYEGIR